MKLDTELKPGDIVLLKGLGCVLIVVLFMQLLIFPGLNKHEDLSASLEAKTAQRTLLQICLRWRKPSQSRRRH